MAANKLCFKDYMKCADDKKLSKTRKKLNRKRKDGSSKNVYGWAGYGGPPNISGALSTSNPVDPGIGGAGGNGAAGGGMGESYELAATEHPSRIKNIFKYNRRGLKFLDYLNSEDEEEEDDDNILAAFDRNRQRGEEIDDFMSGEHRNSTRYRDRHGAPADDLDMWSDIDSELGDFDPDARRPEMEFDDDEFMSRHFPEDEESFDVDPEEDPDEYERRYDVEPREDDDHCTCDEVPDYDFDDDDPEYADEVTVGNWTIRRIDDEDVFDEEDYEYAEDAEEPSKKDQARALYRAMKSGDYSRKEIISAFEKRLGLSPSSSTAYYERIAKEYGETEQIGDKDAMGQSAGAGMGDMAAMGMGMGDMMGQEEPEYQDPQEWEDPHRQGVIRNVQGAHLVYKRQADDGSFEELWIYKEGDKFQDELSIRHDVLAGTDIPVNNTRSPDGSQKAETWSVGDVQYLNIRGLPN